MKKIYAFLIMFGMINSLLAGDRFIRDDTKDVVLDTKSNLMWQDNSDAKTVVKDWEEAIDYCENLTLGGYDDWHLPNYNKLCSLTDRSRINPAIDPVFINFVSNGYWSSSTLSNDNSYAWDVVLYDGDDGYGDKSNSFYIRCVRENN